MVDISAETAVRSVLNRIDAAWRLKKFDDLEQCFDESAVIVGPNYRQYAVGPKECANSYREFATNAAVIEYAESDHQLRIWPDTAVYTFTWQMTYTRDKGPNREVGTDQIVLGRFGESWRVLFRYIYFAPTT
jgi:hypothetical protein